MEIKEKRLKKEHTELDREKEREREKQKMKSGI